MTLWFSWDILFGVGVVVVGLAIAWGLHSSRTRNRANDPVAENAARLLREHGEERYEREDKPHLEAQVARNESEHHPTG